MSKMENKLIPLTQSSLGFFGIFRESLKTTSRNGKLLVPILLLVFISFSQLEFAQKYILTPVAKDYLSLVAKHPNFVQDFVYHMDQTTYVGAIDDLREILLVELLILAISNIISLLFLVATVSSSSEAYTAKVLGPKDMFQKIKASWKRPLATSFYMILLTLGVFTLYLIGIGLASVLAVNYWALFLFGAIIISVPVCWIYLSALWMVSVVVSILEEGVGGVKAIGRAKELMKGKKLQASLMMVPFAMSFVVVQLMAKSVRSYNLSWSTQMAITIPFRNGLSVLLKLLMFVVYTVFYHERKTNHADKEGKGVYLPIAAGEA